MAGSERSGPLAASAALFDGRPWAVTPHAGVRPGGRRRWSRRWSAMCGAVPVRLDPGEHDRAVARTSHLPHLPPSWSPAGWPSAPPEHLALSGQGVRDVTRVAASDPALWQQILGANAEAVLDLLGEVRERARRADRGGRRRRPPALLEILARGVAGTAGDPRQARRPGAARPARSSSRCPTTPASWRGCSATPARSGSTSRTSTSTTTRAVRSAWSSSSSRRAAPSTCWLLSNPAGGRLTGSLLGREHRRRSRPLSSPSTDSGSGKSSTSRGVAERLGLRYLDTGAMFRAMTWWLLRQGVDVARRRGRRRARRRAGASSPAPTRSARRSWSTATTSSVAIRSDEVNAAVSPVSAVPEVRARLLELQREVIGDGGIVVEGRDIGSVVWPQAEVKVYLTADPDARAAAPRRRGRAAPTWPAPASPCWRATGSTPAAPRRR